MYVDASFFDFLGIIGIIGKDLLFVFLGIIWILSEKSI